jgi:phage-related protein
MAGIDDEVIQSGENLLLTFGNVKNGLGKGNDVFNQTTAAALDMSAATGGDLNGSISALGKALNDPEKGLKKLAKSGVVFTDQQKEQVKALVKSGDTLGAQKILLAGVQKQYAGSAAAAADPMAKLDVQVGNLKESIGTALMPIINGFVDVLGKVATFVENNSALIKPLVLVLGSLAAIIFAIIQAQKIWTAVQTAFNVVMNMNPIGLIIAAVVALIAIFVVAYNKVGWFHKAVDAVWQAIQVGWDALLGAFRWAWNNIGSPIFAVIRGAISLWWNYYVKPIFLVVSGVFEGIWKAVRWAWDHVGKPIFDTITDVVSGVVGIISGVWDGIVGGIKKIWNGFADIWNGFVDEINISIYNPFGDDFELHGRDFEIPKLHSGGEYRAPRVGGEGLALLRDREVVVTPEQIAAGGRTSTTTNVFNISERIDPHRILAAQRRTERLYGHG